MSIKVAVYLADQNPHRDRSMGITSLTQTLLGGLVEAPGFELTTLSSRSSYRFEDEKVNDVRLSWRTDNSKILRIFTDNLHPTLFRQVQADIWYYPKGIISYVQRPRQTTVTTIHDTILQHYADKYPQERSRYDYLYWLSMLKASIAKSDLVLTVSETAKEQILVFCSRHHIPEPQIYVTYEASDFEKETTGNFADKSDYVVHLASSNPHKRTHTLLQWWQELQQEGTILPPLKLIGKPDKGGQQLARQLDGVEMLPRLDQSTFVQTIREARALLFPSEIEGFGLPAIEGYFVGTPIVYARGSAVEEILSTATDLGGFSLTDKQSFLQSLNSILALPEEDVHRIGTNLRERFSRAKYVQQVQAALAGLVNQSTTYTATHSI